MIRIFTLALPAISFLTITAQAAPLESTPNPTRALAQRDNNYNLQCCNAPSVVAGTFLSPSLLPAAEQNGHELSSPPPKSGSNEDWMDYLWCTPNTTTYTFFGVGVMTPAPPTNQNYDVNGALSAAVSIVSTYLQTNKDGPIARGNWTLSPLGTNIQIYVQNSKGTMTYGILGSALTGLAEVASNYIHRETTLVFQINDGKWGETGIGYLGFNLVGGMDGCVYDIVNGKGFPCSDVQEGWVIK